MSEEKSNLTDAQKARIEKNRIKANILKHAKLVPHPLAVNNKVSAESSIVKVQGTKYVDSGGGFLIEQNITVGANGISAKTTDLHAKCSKLAKVEAINIPVVFQNCLECEERFSDSYLFKNFDYAVCDNCRDPDEKHSLITRTEAKAEYLLKDCDFDKREPPLKFISRKNPHNVRWGEMKLYLHMQVEKRALEVWGSEEELMKQHEGRETKREVSKVKKYNKKLKQLRMEIRSSLYAKDTKANHTHEFGNELYNEEDDTYTHTCLTCPFTESFEKM